MAGERTRILIAADASNFEYMCAWAAFNDFCMADKDLFHSVVKTAKETDQENLPNLLNYDLFRRILGRVVEKKLESIAWIAKGSHQAEIDAATGMDIVFTEDDGIAGNFRRLKYPEYKAQRKLAPKRFDINATRDYIRSVVMKDLDLTKRHGYHFVKVPDCESDDIIAVLMKRFNDYICRIIISSDRDFLQLENVDQYDFWGKKLERRIKGTKGNDDVELSPRDFLLWKILRGDKADNIGNVFPKYGDIKSLRLVKDRGTLRRMLKESGPAGERYKLNKFLISFESIPHEIEERIYDVLRRELDHSDEDAVEEFTLSGCMEI